MKHQEYELSTFEVHGCHGWKWEWELKNLRLYICSYKDDGYSSRKSAVVGAKRAAQKLGIIIKTNRKGL